MAEKLLTKDQVACRLMIDVRTLDRRLPILRTKGLQVVRMGRQIMRFRESSLNKLIKKAAERESDLFAGSLS